LVEESETTDMVDRDHRRGHGLQPPRCTRLSRIRDSGNATPRTQFVIADSEERWEDQRWRLKGVGPGHQDAIKRYQPFAGCQWTGLLRDLNNPDKHRTLTSVYVEFSGELRIDWTQAEPVPDDPERLGLQIPSQTVIAT
jgi:hypothetical protein